MKITKRFRIEPSSHIRLTKIASDATPGCHDKDAALETLGESLAAMRKLQYRLFAENRRSVLIVLQAMDAAGKDGLVQHVMSGMNPQGCRVTSFKVPSVQEKQHDFLWRVHQAMPPAGEIGIFNRSHYEDVLVVRVRQLAPPAVWKARYAMINDFEHYLSDNGVTIVKFFLHISRAEQAQRLQERLDDPDRNWKFTPADIEERRFWDDYQRAYEDVLERCSTPWAPWHVIPSDHKWYRNWAVAEILRHTLEKMDLRFPPPLHDVRDLRRRLRTQEARKR